MLSSTPAIPLSSIEMDSGGRRLSLRTAGGMELFTNRDALPSPEHLTPIEGHTPTGSGAATPRSENGRSRQASQTQLVDHYEDGQGLYKAPSNGGLWHDSYEVSVQCCNFLASSSQCCPSHFNSPAYHNTLDPRLPSAHTFPPP